GFDGGFEGLRDTWHAPKGSERGGVEGLSVGASEHKAHYEGKIERVFRRDFQDTWHSPKDGPEGGFDRDFEGGFRQGFGLAPKEFLGRASGTRGVFRRKVRRVSGLGHLEGF